MDTEGNTPQSGTAPSDSVEIKSAAELFAEEEESHEGQSEPEADEEAGETGKQDDEAEGEEPKAEASEESEEAEGESDDGEDSASSIEIEGKSYTLEEVKKGFMLQADYTRKTQELAEHKKEFASAVERLEQQDQATRGALAVAQEVLKAFIPPEPDIGLVRTDQAAYLEQKAMRDQAMAIVAQLQSQMTNVEEQSKSRSSDMSREQFAAELEKAKAKIPEIASDEGLSKFRNDAIAYAKAKGFDAPDFGSVTTAFHLQMLSDAMKFRKLQSEKMKAVAKAKTAPKIAKPGTRPTKPVNDPLAKLRSMGREVKARDIFAAMEEGD